MYFPHDYANIAAVTFASSCLFSYKTFCSPKQSQNSRSVLQDGSRIFRIVFGEKHIAELHKGDLDILDRSEGAVGGTPS